MVKDFEEADLSLRIWADWQHESSAHLGYPRCSPEQKIPGSGKGRAVFNERAELVESILLRARPIFLKAFKLYYLYRYTQVDCAKRLRMSQGTFSLLLSEALQFVERELSV